MKSIKLMAAALALMIFASACPMPLPRAIIKPNSSARNEVIVTPELKALLEETPRPKLVIRVSNPPANVTEAEKFNAYINLIEKTLMQNAFTVRDRALLENLMRSGNADYKTIGEKIDTDIILDILSLQFDIPNRWTTYLNLTTNQNETFRFPDNFVDCQLAKLECRLTIVTKGQLGGMFTFYASRCDVQDLEFVVNNYSGTMMWANSQTPQMYRDLSVPNDTEQIKAYFVTYLAHSLMNQLLEGINSRLEASKKLYDEGRYSEAQEIVADLIKKDPNNFMPYLYQAVIYAQQGDFSKAQLELEKAMGKSDAQFKKAATYYGFAMVYALKNDKGLALSFLRKGLDNGLGSLIKYQEIRSNKDLARLASSPEFEALLSEFEKPAPVQTGKKK
jgi:hypothetical protein